MLMVVLGIDAHKRTHTVVAVDAAGRQLGVRVTKTTSMAAYLDLVRWADRFGPGPVVGGGGLPAPVAAAGS